MNVKVMICMLPVAWILWMLGGILLMKLSDGTPFPIGFLSGSIFFLLTSFAAIVAFNTYFERQRRRELQQLARKHGLHFRTARPFRISHRYGFELFNYCSDIKEAANANHCLYGRHQELPITLFDCSYRFGRSEAELSALLARLDFRAPHLIIRPQKVPSGLTVYGFDTEGKRRTSPESVLGLESPVSRQDCIHFAAEDFGRAFQVRCDDESFAFEICHTAMREFLLRNQSLCWELRGKYLLLHRAKRAWSSPQELESYLRLAHEFVARIPEPSCKRYRPPMAGHV